MRRSPSRAEWDAYILRFHRERPGITDEVLRRCTSATHTPYSWLTDELPESQRVLDLACGNGPLRALIGRDWIGIDASRSELAAIPKKPNALAIAGDVRQLPIRSASCDTAVCSMALMLVDPLEYALAEIARVLRPGSVARLLLPTHRALTARDRVRYLRLGIMLHTVAGFPTSPLDRHAHASLARANLTITDDQTHRFSYRIRDHAAARLFIESLYLPGVSAARVDNAINLAGRWTGSNLGIALRRVTAVLRQ
jgi:SAM-dependent methyltransferase